MIATTLSVFILVMGTTRGETTEREIFIAEHHWLTPRPIIDLRQRETPSMFIKRLHYYIRQNDFKPAIQQQIFNGCTSYLELKIGKKMELIDRIYVQQDIQSPFDKVDIRTRIGKILEEYEAQIEDDWEMASYKFCRSILENRQPRTLYKLLDWIDTLSMFEAEKLYQENEYESLIEFIGAKLSNSIRLNKGYLDTVSRNILNLCSKAQQNVLDATNYEKFNMAMNLSFINSAYEFLENNLLLKPEQQSSAKKAFRLCQKIQELYPTEPIIENEKTAILKMFHQSPNLAKLEANFTRKSYHDLEQYLEMLVHFFETTEPKNLTIYADETFGICSSVLEKKLEKTAFSCYHRHQHNYTNIIKRSLCNDRFEAHSHLAHRIDKTSSKLVQKLEPVCQLATSFLCHVNFGSSFFQDGLWEWHLFHSFDEKLEQHYRDHHRFRSDVLENILKRSQE